MASKTPEATKIACPKCRYEQAIPTGGIKALSNNRDLITVIEVLNQKGPVGSTLKGACQVCSMEDNLQACEHCDKSICPLCKEKHLKHFKDDVETLLTRLKTETDLRLSALEEATDSLKPMKDALNRKIDDAFEDIKGCLKQREASLIEDIDKEASKQLKKSEEKQKEKDSKINDMTEYLNCVRAMIGEESNNANIDALLNIKANLFAYVQDLSKMQSEQTYGVINVSFEDEALKTAISKYGVLKKQDMEEGAVGGQESDEDGDEEEDGDDSEGSFTSERSEVADMADFGEVQQNDLMISTQGVIREPLKIVGKRGKHPGCFSLPSGITVSPVNGNIVVSDNHNNRIQIFDVHGNFINMFGRKGRKVGQFQKPRGVAVNMRGQIIVADSHNNRVQVFNQHGRFEHMFGKHGMEFGLFRNPAGLAVDKYGNIFVCDERNHRVQVFRSDGTFLRILAARNTGVFYPSHIAIDKNGVVIVTGSNNRAILIFSHEGQRINAIRFEDMKSSKGVALNNNDGSFYVADSANCRVLKFDGKKTTVLGTLGSDAGYFNKCMDVALTHNGSRLVVADCFNNRLQIFQLPF